MAVYNFDNFQINHTGLGDTMTGGITAQGRNFGMRMSNFGALVGGVRSSADYTQTSLGFADKDTLMNPGVPPFVMEGDYSENPFVWGSTVKRTRNDEFAIMGMGNRRSNSATDAPKFDVTDTRYSVDDGTNVPKQFPAEGWSTFGGRTAGPFGYTPPGTRNL
jgi:hypothetical protein